MVRMMAKHVGTVGRWKEPSPTETKPCQIAAPAREIESNPTLIKANRRKRENAEMKQSEGEERKQLLFNVTGRVPVRRTYCTRCRFVSRKKKMLPK